MIQAYARMSDLEDALEALIHKIEFCNDSEMLCSKAYEDAKDVLEKMR